MRTMANSYLCTFKELFSLDIDESEKVLTVSKISIPLIQRDYAQGRKNPDVNRIREKFLGALKNAVQEKPVCLDFIYGDVNDSGVLTLLDGQQRITTLFLLHWYAAQRENISKEEYEFLSRFSYETRPSSREFCKRLVDFKPDFDSLPLTAQIIDQSWFPLDWQNDPTIESMLVMINEINNTFKDVKNLWNALTEDRKIQFYFLPIKNMGLTDELYIKMNSRGKPLTKFEHFKAAIEHEIRLMDKSLAEDFEVKLENKWTDFLWGYRKDDFLIDGLFLNYLKFICDIITYEKGKSTQGRNYDELSLIDEFFSHDDEPDGQDNVRFLTKAFDSFCDLKLDIKTELFEKHLSIESLTDKAKVSGNVDLLDHCFKNYIDPKTGKRSFSLGQIILLYSFMQYAMNYKSISSDQFNERIRIINNLIMNSSDEIRDNDDSVKGNRMPAILKQTKSIILDGKILNQNEIENNFNVNQLNEEREKQEWRINNPDKIADLNLLENHDLLQGQISIVGLENSNLFKRFYEAFSCDRDLVSCALLTFGDYSRVEKNWRYTFGTRTNDSAWKFLFHMNAVAKGFEKTHAVLISLLNSNEHIDEEYLKKLVNNYLEKCENERLYDWRYYFIKYDEFRPDRFGKYWIKKNNYYDIYVMVTSTKLSENSYQPFLKVIDSDHLDRDDYGTRLKYDNNFVFCESNRFVVKDSKNEEKGKIPISQNENGIDTENRIEKYRSSKKEFFKEI